MRRLALLAALAAVVLGLGDRDEPLPTRLPELDVIVVVDRTTSMSAIDDPAGSRLAAAGRDLVALSEQLESARFTVITVGKTAKVALPPTSDRIAFEDTVTQLPAEPADVGTGSASDRAVPLVEEVLDDEAEGDDERLPVLVYVGDGEDSEPDPAARFDALGARLATALVLGYGTEAGGMMPLVLAGQRSDPAQPAVYLPDPETGQPAVSRADPARLASIAAQVGGTLVRPASAEDVVAAATELQRTAYADLPPVRAARQLSWVWGLALLLLVLPELRTGWRTWWAARRAVAR